MAKAETKAQLKDMKKAIDSLQEGVTKLETRVDRHETRLDRIEKSTQLVVEFAPDLETIYQQAQVTREFKNLCKDGAAAVLKALGHVLHLPYPIPSDQASSDWHKANPDPQSSAVVDQWYMLCPALEHSTRFISPNPEALLTTLPSHGSGPKTISFSALSLAWLPRPSKMS